MIVTFVPSEESSSESRWVIDHPGLAMRADVERNHVRHEQVVILSLQTEPAPWVSDVDRVDVDTSATATTGSSTSPPTTFLAMSHITADAADQFHLPRDRTISMGSRIGV